MNNDEPEDLSTSRDPDLQQMLEEINAGKHDEYFQRLFEQARDWNIPLWVPTPPSGLGYRDALTRWHADWVLKP